MMPDVLTIDPLCKEKILKEAQAFLHRLILVLPLYPARLQNRSCTCYTERKKAKTEVRNCRGEGGSLAIYNIRLEITTFSRIFPRDGNIGVHGLR